MARMNRRDFLKYATIGAGGLILPMGLQQAMGYGEHAHSHGATRRAGVSAGDITSPVVAKFQVPLPRPPVVQPVSRDATTDYYEITMKEGRQQILPGLTTTIWGYNGVYPGPTIEATRGRRVVAKFTNTLPEAMSVHYHGGITAPEHDGYAEDIKLSNGQTLPTLIRPGGAWTYQFPNQQAAATNWYHDHGIHYTARHVYQGLSGFYLLRDDQEASFNLPKGEFEVPLVLQDRIFNASGALVYDNNGHEGVVGDVQLVNGAPWPRLQVAARKYRFRLLNGANWRRYDLQLSNGQPLIQIGTDAGLLRAPISLTRLLMFQGERNDIIIDFSKLPVGTTVKLLNKAPEAVGTRMEEVMLFEVVRTAVDDSQVPATLASWEVLTAAAATPGLPERHFKFDRTNGYYTINGRIWDKNRFDATPRLGTTEIWRFENSSGGWFHPIHLHLVDFQILDRTITSDAGSPKQRRVVKAPEAWERGRKDVVALGESQEVRVIIKWDAAKYQNFTGPYMIHCHNIDHEDHDMMTQYNLLPAA